MILESQLKAEDALYTKVVEAGDYWIHKIKAGQSLRILDLEGNQAADTLFYSADNTAEHYSAMDTCLLYTSPSPRDQRGSRMPSSA